MMNLLSFSHQATRLDFDVGQPYEKFRSRYEAAVPAADLGRIGESGGRHARWSDITADADKRSRRGFLLYWRADMPPLMTAAGELRPCTGYLMGHRDIAGRIYRQDPALLLYAPLRSLIYIDCGDRTRFAVEQPSAVFASFADPVIAALGLDLDRQLTELLEALGVDAGPELGAGVRPGQATASASKVGQCRIN